MSVPDYTVCKPADLLYKLNDDGEAWAKAFCQHFPEFKVDERTLALWFTNAIDHSHNMRVGHEINNRRLAHLVARMRK